MKRKALTLALAAVLCAGLLCGCGSKSSAPRETAAASMKNAGGSYVAAMDYDYAAGESAPTASKTEESGSLTGGQGARAETFDKIIYSGAATVETIDFDGTVDGVYALVERMGGFLEYAYVDGKDYYTQASGRNSYRHARFTIRVPRERFSDLNGELESLGSLTSSSVQAQNITSAYTDTESRLSTYRTEEKRLLAMLEKADNVEDMLSIEARLSDVRYNLESLTTTLTNWDSKLSYSTLELSVSEVKELTVETPITRTFGDELVSGVRDSFRWLVRALRDSVIFLASAIPVLILPVAVLVAVLLIVRAKKRKKAKRAAENDVKNHD